MNIKVKAGLEVACGITAMVLIIAGVRAILESLSTTYGPEAVANGATFVLASSAAYFIVGVLYDYRVSKLKYKQTLEEMTKK